MPGLKYWENWEEIHEYLEDIEYRIYGLGEDEEDYIDEMVNTFLRVNPSHHGERVQTKVYKTHGYPQAEFIIPARTGFQKCEIADLCFDFEIEVNGITEERRALLSQAKMSENKENKWTIDLAQHFLLTYFPPFRSPNLGSSGSSPSYDLGGPHHQFSNYSLASKHQHPVYCTTFEIGRQLANWDYTQNTSTYYHDSIPTYLLTTVGFISSLVNGYSGSNLLTNTKLESFVDDLIDYASGKNITPQPDGGRIREIDDEDGFVVIRILVSREE